MDRPSGRVRSCRLDVVEVGQLRQVTRRTDQALELSRLISRNVSGLLFDDVMSAKKAKEEHDAFALTSVPVLADSG